MARQPAFSSHDPLLDAQPNRTLDLHGRTESEARVAVEKLVKTSGGKLVHVVTGKGRNSSDGPVLKHLVRGMLKGSLAPLVRDWSLDDSEGGYRILVR